MEARNFTVYWRGDTVRHTRRTTLNYAASNSLHKAVEGDVLWILSVHSGRLFLISRLVVDRIADRKAAPKLIGHSDIWDANWYAVAKNSERIDNIDITHLIGDITFRSTKSRLHLNNGKFDAQQVRAMRLLTNDSAKLFESVWGTTSQRTKAVTQHH